jgi:hypothetical protein
LSRVDLTGGTQNLSEENMHPKYRVKMLIKAKYDIIIREGYDFC